MFIFVSALLILASILLAWLRNRRNHQYVFLNQGVPGPKPNIILGNFSILLNDDAMRKFLDDARYKYGKSFSFCFGKNPAFFTTEADHLQEVLVKNFDNFRNRGGLASVNDITNHSVLTLKDKDWKRVRSILSPSFSAAKLKSMMSRAMKKRTTYLLEEVNRESSQEEVVDFYSLFRRLTLDVIAECGFGMDINSVKNYDEALPLLRALRSVVPAKFGKSDSSDTDPGIISILFGILRGLMNTKEKTAMKEELDSVQRYCGKIVKERRSRGTREHDVLQFMIDSKIDNKDALNEDEIIANTFTFLFAGFETTSTALSFIALLLASYPEVQKKLHQEIVDNIPSPDEATFDDVKKLPYLDQVWHEGLRIYAPAPAMFGREVSKTTKLGNVTLPAGTWVMMSPMMVHSDPDYWPDPDQFLPERWAPENRDSINPMTFLPFGEGPRQCIGKRFAEIESKLALLKLIHAFELSPANKANTHPVKIGTIVPTLTPAAGSILLKAKKRT